jgi:hypothetical protein
MSDQRIYKLAIIFVVVALLGLACSACASTPEPTPPPPIPTVAPTEPPTVAPPTPTEAPAEEPAPSPEPPTQEPTEQSVVEPTPCPQVKCLPNCYANNLAPAGGDGTKNNPWRGSAADRKFFEDIECAAQKRGIIPSSLTILTCSANLQTCNGVYYTYDGQWASTQLAETPPNPYVGVGLPFVFVLVGVAVLGLALLGTGIFLRLRARTPGF